MDKNTEEHGTTETDRTQTSTKYKCMGWGSVGKMKMLLLGPTNNFKTKKELPWMPCILLTKQPGLLYKHQRYSKHLRN